MSGASRFDFSSLSSRPPEEALRELIEYCSWLEERNEELETAYRDAQCVLQSFVRTVLQRDGLLAEQQIPLDITLGDFLGLQDLPQTSPPAQNPVPELIATSPISESTEESEETSPREAACSSEETESASCSDIPEETSTPEIESESETSSPFPEPVIPNLAAILNGSSSSSSEDSSPSMGYVDERELWHDSPMAIPEFGDEETKIQRDELANWLRHPDKELDLGIFTTEQRDLFEDLLSGDPHISALSQQSCQDDTQLAKLSSLLQNKQPVWDNFTSYINQLLREWSLDISADEDYNAYTTGIPADRQPLVTYAATSEIQSDTSFETILTRLNNSIYHLGDLELTGCETGLPVSIRDEEDKARIMLHHDWCKLGENEKVCLANWHLHSALCYPLNLRKALHTVLSIEDTPEDLGITLIKRTASVAMSRSRNIPPNLIMEISGLWGSESLEELDELLTNLYENSDQYSPFLYAREMIASPQPLRQLLDLQADAISLKLTNIVSATRAIIAQDCGALRLLSNGSELGLLVRTSSPHLAYLQRRLAGLWVTHIHS